MNWRKTQWKDPGYRKAKLEGYRSRAAYKLIEMNQKFRLVSPVSKVLDLGCAPGGWLQVLKRLGVTDLIGLDLQKVQEIPGVRIGQLDFTDEASVERFLSECAVEKSSAILKFDLILSDMAPNISGCHDRDHYESVRLVETVYEFGKTRLCHTGKMVCKLFDGPETQSLLNQCNCMIPTRIYKPTSSRSESRELYLVSTAKGC
jgi:23S rRNA (uridine2552-2'-O)-methyltransferase